MMPFMAMTPPCITARPGCAVVGISPPPSLSPKLVRTTILAMVTHLAQVVLAITVITVIACTPSKPRAVRTTDAPENQAVLIKLRSYIVCLDEHAARVFEIADGYTHRLGGREPTLQDR